MSKLENNDPPLVYSANFFIKNPKPIVQAAREAYHRDTTWVNEGVVRK